MTEQTDVADDTDDGRETEQYHVIAAEKIPNGERILIEVESAEIMICNIAGEFYGIQNACRHQGGPMCEGNLLYPSYLESEMTDDSWKFSQNTEVPTVTCPWHGWEYSLETGEHVAPTDYSLRTYPLTLKDGELYIELPSQS